MRIGVKILGIWDSRAYPLTLGGVLFFVEELEMQRFVHKVSSVDIAIVGDKTMLEGCQALRKVMIAFENVGICYWGVSGEELECTVNNGAYIVWPSPLGQRPDPRRAMFAQAFYREHGFIPYLQCNKGLYDWADRFIASLDCKRVVVVHLKNNPDEVRRSNARQDIWGRFFKEAACWDVRFVLIGDDFVNEEVLALPNVVRARAIGSDLACDMALIRKGCFFMGMSSGPCNMAILGDRPYVIYKNPDHDVQEMDEELGTADRFLFAGTGQKFLRKNETVEDLLDNFKELYCI